VESGQSAPRGWGYEWASTARLAGLPLVHIAVGFDSRGRPRIARGVIAVGQFAVGLVSISQFGFGLLLGIGQFMSGLLCLAQFAVGGVALAQFAVGWLAYGQIAIGYAGAASAWGWFFTAHP